MSSIKINGKKLCLLGNTGVGKTSIAKRIVKKKDYNHNYLEEPTIGASFVCAKYTDKQNNEHRFNIWDTAGQERYRSLAPLYYRDSIANVLVYDITNIDSWNAIDYWLNEIKKHLKNSIIVLVGNKYDMKDQICIDETIVDNYCKDNNIKHVYFSAKINENANEILDIILSEYSNMLSNGILEEIPLFDKKDLLLLDKDRYWCSNNLSFGCCS